MAGIPIIIQAGVHGLEVAADYYQQFPWEPSPAGDLDLQNANIVKVQKLTFDQLLVELAKTSAGGTVLIVCHAHDESGRVLQSSGLFMPLAAGSGTSANDDAFQRLKEQAPPTIEPRRSATCRQKPIRRRRPRVMHGLV